MNEMVLNISKDQAEKIAADFWAPLRRAFFGGRRKKGLTNMGDGAILLKVR